MACHLNVDAFLTQVGTESAYFSLLEVSFEADVPLRLSAFFHFDRFKIGEVSNLGKEQVVISFLISHKWVTCWTLTAGGGETKRKLA